MKKLILSLLTIVCIVLFGCSKILNYEKPETTYKISGKNDMIVLENDEKIPLLTQQRKTSSKEVEVKDFDMGSVKEWALKGVDIDKTKLDDQMYVEISGKVGNDEYKSYVLHLDIEKVK